MEFNLTRKVSTGHARKLHLNYLSRQHKPPKEKDTIAVWFPRKILEQALAGETVSGIRFYLGAYEHNHRDHPRNKAYRGMVTLICVQTWTDSSGIDPVERDILADPDALPEYDPITEPLEFNDGQLCPPGTGCDDEGLPNIPESNSNIPRAKP